MLGRSGALLAVAQALADGGKALADYRASQCDPHAMLAQAALQSLPWSELQMAVAGRSADVHGSTHGSARLLNESEYMPFSVGLIRDSWPLVSCNTPRLTAEPRLCYDTFCACERTGFLRVARREHRRLDLRPQPGTPCRDVGRQGNAVLQGG